MLINYRILMDYLARLNGDRWISWTTVWGEPFPFVKQNDALYRQPISKHKLRTLTVVDRLGPFQHPKPLVNFISEYLLGLPDHSPQVL